MEFTDSEKKLKTEIKELKSFIIEYSIKNKKTQNELKQKIQAQNILNQKLFAQSIQIDQRNLEIEEYTQELKSTNEKLKEQNEIILKSDYKIKEQYQELKQNNEELHTLNEELFEKKEIIEKNHKSIQDSINYASKIQNALLPSQKYIDKLFNNFVLYLPKQVVSGDFYLFREIGKYKIFTVADSTGHGVPGGFITMLGINFINNILDKNIIKKPSEILEILRKDFKKIFKFSEQKDGMDIILCIFNTETNILEFSGANNHLVLIRDNQLTEYKSIKNPIGYYYKEQQFITHQIEIKKNDNIYLYSDGFQDQFGGKNDRKFRSKNFRDLLYKIHKLEMKKQKEKLSEIFFNWKGKMFQIDDVLVVGIKF